MRYIIIAKYGGFETPFNPYWNPVHIDGPERNIINHADWEGECILWSYARDIEDITQFKLITALLVYKKLTKSKFALFKIKVIEEKPKLGYEIS